MGFHVLDGIISPDGSSWTMAHQKPISLHTLTYVSTATRMHDVSALIEIMHESRRNNVLRDITGILLYNDGAFMQTIEGEEQAITELYDRLLLDDRHHSLIKLVHETVENRAFANWSISFKSPGVDFEGYSNYLNDPEANIFDNDLPSYAKSLLESFKRGIR